MNTLQSLFVEVVDSDFVSALFVHNEVVLHYLDLQFFHESIIELVLYFIREGVQWTLISYCDRDQDLMECDA